MFKKYLEKIDTHTSTNQFSWSDKDELDLQSQKALQYQRLITSDPSIILLHEVQTGPTEGSSMFSGHFLSNPTCSVASRTSDSQKLLNLTKFKKLKLNLRH